MAQAISGSPFPLGVTLVEGGVNVAVVSKHAQRVYFCLFDGDEEKRFELSSREGDVHYSFFPGVTTGQRYGLRADGAHDVAKAHLFDVSKLLIDPFATQLDRVFAWHRDLAVKGAETWDIAPKCIITVPQPHAQQLPYKTPGFIYEVAAKAFTRLHPQIPEKLRGTVAALAHPACIEHFLRLWG